MAQHYLHRFGTEDTKQNSTRAGVYLLAAAELGDSNAQQMRLGAVMSVIAGEDCTCLCWTGAP